jgi:acyl-CoA reductase-like NAD-dependent aldehyde dehydrogenase
MKRKKKMTENKEPSMSENKIVVKNPATGEVLAQLKSHSFDEGKDAIRRAHVAQKKWEATPLHKRIETLKQFQYALVDHAKEVAELIAKENGKPLAEAITTEVLPVVDLTAYFCKRAPKLLAPKHIPLHLLKHRKSYLHYRPHGVVFVISPWNFPFTIPTGEIVMALLAGNAVVHKPASLTPLVALKTRELFDRAGLDPDLYQVLPTNGETAFKLIGEGVNYVNFTGSTAVGRKVSEACGKWMIPCSMELGGKDPMIVCADADIDLAAGSLVWGAFANAGQVCASVERGYIHESIFDQVAAKVVEKVKQLKVGNPLEDGVSMGPMTDAQQLGVVIQQVEDARKRGAKILTGGYKIEGPGQFYAPTVLVDVDESFECVAEETFGPTLPLMKYRDEDEVITRANNSRYGLNAYVFTTNKHRARRIAEQLEAGTVMINEVLITHGCPETPWGGVKESGVGRVHGDEGLRSLCIPYHVNQDAIRPPSWSPFWQPYSHKMYRGLVATIRALWGRGVGGRLEGVRNIFSAGKTPEEMRQ